MPVAYVLFTQVNLKRSLKNVRNAEWCSRFLFEISV